MAAQRGARVLATARPEVANYVTSLGAAQALDYTQGDLVSAVRTLYPGGVDAVLDVATRDPAGLSHISHVLPAGGRLLTAIVTTEAPRLAEQGINAALLSWQPSAGLLGGITRVVTDGQLDVDN